MGGDEYNRGRGGAGNFAGFGGIGWMGRGAWAFVDTPGHAAMPRWVPGVWPRVCDGAWGAIYRKPDPSKGAPMVFAGRDRPPQIGAGDLCG